MPEIPPSSLSTGLGGNKDDVIRQHPVRARLNPSHMRALAQLPLRST